MASIRLSRAKRRIVHLMLRSGPTLLVAALFAGVYAVNLERITL